MRKVRRNTPAGKLELVTFRRCRNELDGGFYDSVAIVPLGEKNAGAFGATEELKQREVPVDNLPDKLFPGVGHDSTHS
jgi:hypothetical protein